jgi:hypothetical protein
MLAVLYSAILYMSIPVALMFFTWFGVSRRRACLVAGLLWLLPVPYELLIQANCPGECNIRIDLLLALPAELLVLGLASVVAFRSFGDFRRERAGR